MLDILHYQSLIRKLEAFLPKPPVTEGISLLDGQSGLLIIYATLKKTITVNAWPLIGRTACITLNTHPIDTSLSGGLAGSLWTVQQLINLVVLEADGEQLIFLPS